MGYDHCTLLTPTPKQEMLGQKSEIGRRKETKSILDAVESDTGELVHPARVVERDWTHDLPSITLLLVLYTLQGIPMGLSGSIPFLLLDKVRSWS